MNKLETIPTIAMSIQAHPDDQEFTVAGTLAKWARQGCQVISVLVTSGDAGSNDPSKGGDYKSSLALVRENEQIAANLVLGIHETAFLHYPDGELEATLQLRKDLTRLIRQYKPEVVVTNDPSRVYFGSKKPNVWVDIRSTLDLKITALKKHASQLGDWDPTDEMRKWAAETGRKKGLKAAEAFKVMTLVEDMPES
jgi:LmbE family N-acetylglucosaminyl deacetylase